MKRSLILILVGVLIGAAIVAVVSYFAGVSYGSTTTKTVYTNSSASNNTSSTPESLPKAIPIYKPSSAYVSSKSPNGLFNVTYTSSASASSVDGFYQNQLSANGWAITNEATSSPNIYTYNARGHGYFVVLAIWPRTNSSGSSFTFLIYP